MDVVSTKISSEVERFLDGQVGEILLPERHDLAFSNETGELILPGIVQLAELFVLFFCVVCWGEVRHFSALRKQVRIGGIGVLPMLMMLEWFERWVFLLGIPGLELILILSD